MARVAPQLLALLSYALLCSLVLLSNPKFREPDAYAYRAATVSLLEGTAPVLTREQYLDLDVRLREHGNDGWQGQLGIEMWVALSEDRFTSEKNPGYPFLMAPFEQLSVSRLGPLLYGGLA